MNSTKTSVKYVPLEGCPIQVGHRANVKTINDPRDLEVSCDQLRGYLQHKQWFEDGKIRNVATIWHRQDNEDAEVVLPLSYVKDYWQRMRDALASIASFEERSAHEVLNNVKTINNPREHLRDALWVHTTTVQSYDEVSGTFITKNTAYHLHKEE